MNRKVIVWGAAIVVSTVAPQCIRAASSVGFREYAAVVDDVSGSIQVFGQLIVHQLYDVQLGEGPPSMEPDAGDAGTARNIPILSLQQTGRYYREASADDPNHAQARAKSVAERLVHAWALLDLGGRLEIGDDNWNAYELRSPAVTPTHTALFIRTPAPGAEPLRIITIYPEDVAGYPWVSSERSLAEYLGSLIQAHHLLFWKNEVDMTKYDALRIGRTAEGRIFREIAIRAAIRARRKGQGRFDRETLREVLAGMTVGQRETLCRLATVPPMDWETWSQP